MMNCRQHIDSTVGGAVPITLSDLTLDVPAPLMALIEDASVALAQFDDTAAHHLGEQVHTLGPMSAVLLRTEATSSSQIEHLTVGAKNLAMELLHEGNSAKRNVVWEHRGVLDVLDAYAARLRRQ